MFRTRFKKLIMLAVVAGVASACDTGTGPDALAIFDANAALEDYQKLDAILSSNTMTNFRTMGAAVSLETFGPAPKLALMSAAELRSIRSEGDARAFARGLLDAMRTSGPVATYDQLISDQNRGKTFVYDAEQDEYVHDPAQTGAPATGVRFILYEEASNGKPDPSQEIGYADLIDEGDNSAQEIALKLVVVHGSDAMLEYRTTIDAVADGGTITVDGFVRDENDRLDFAIDVTGSSSGSSAAVDITFEIRVDNRDFRINGSVSGMDDGSESGEIDLTVRHGADSIRVDVAGSESSLTGTFFLNGEVFATVSGNPDDPTFVGASGNPLTDVEALVLHRMVDVVEDVFDFFEDLMDPIDELVILAIIL